MAFLFVFFRHTTPLSPGWYVSKLHLPPFVASIAANLSALGAFGVYLFFLLSAYLITVLLLREKREYGKLHVPQFYGRRALRIWPLYFFIIAVGGIYQHYFPPIEWKGMAMLVCFSGNWAMIFGIAKVTPLWSVSVEEQFYLLWPPVVARLSERGIEKAGLAMLAGPLLTLGLARYLGYSDWNLWFMSSFSGLSAMGVGIVLACRTQGRVPAGLPPRAVLGLMGLLAWYGAATLHIAEGITVNSLLGIALIDLGSLAMLLAAMGATPRAVFVELGKISYGLYVYHGWVIEIFERTVGRKALNAKAYPLAIAFEFAVTVFLAWASYRWLESPFLRIKERFTFVRSRPV